MHHERELANWQRRERAIYANRCKGKLDNNNKKKKWTLYLFITYSYQKKLKHSQTHTQQKQTEAYIIMLRIVSVKSEWHIDMDYENKTKKNE